MAHALLADGKTLVDLKGATIQAGDGELFAALVAGGDSNANRTPDVSVSSSVRVPLLGLVNRAPVTRDLPVDQLLALAQTVAPALSAVPGVGPAVATAVTEGIAIARAIFRKF